MKNRIVNFIHLLRESNIRISIAESIEACKALQICDITNKQQFKIALQTTLIKQNIDLSTFDRVFELYFSEPIEKQNEQLTEEEFVLLLESLEQDLTSEQFEELGDKIQNNNSNQSTPNEFNNEFKNYDKHKINKDMYKHGSESDLKEAAKQLANSRNYEDWESENINEVTDRMLIQNDYEYSKAVAKQESRKSKHEEIEKKYEQLKKYLKEEIEKAMVKQFGESIISDLVENDNIYDKDLGDLSIEELEKIQEIIKKIAKKLSTRLSRKDKRSKKGKIDIRRTIRSSIPYGTTSSELKYKNKKRSKVELVVLCDISGSVWMYVSFMLQLAIGIQNLFDKVETYIFVDKIKNVTTDILDSTDLNKTMKNFLYDRSLGYGTDYGNVLKEFYNEKDLFNKKTVLIIMGDGENTGNENGEEYIRAISEQCKVVYWLHPKNLEDWYNPYSIMDIYERYCKDVYQCSTLRHLKNFIKKLIKF